ncbi:hypothetical protein OG786_21120 [Streptomyces sp. NBC_00101]|uniref:hypothetical protein n=1 Tax=Streptomyces sp. NBC_00101 TaxID=2975651 RepID=UPI003251405D
MSQTASRVQGGREGVGRTGVRTAKDRLVILDPEAPGGFRKASYGPVVNGRPLRSPAMRRLVGNLVAHQRRWAERDRQEAVWVERQMAAALPLTVAQTRMLRRVKDDLRRSATESTDVLS